MQNQTNELAAVPQHGNGRVGMWMGVVCFAFIISILILQEWSRQKVANRPAGIVDGYEAHWDSEGRLVQMFPQPSSFKEFRTEMRYGRPSTLLVLQLPYLESPITTVTEVPSPPEAAKLVEDKRSLIR